MAGDFMNWWYGDGVENAAIRNLLFLELTNAKHIAGNVVYYTVGSHPTGDGLTWWWNSIINLIITHHVLTIKMGIPDCDYISTCYGDDAVHAVDRPGITVQDMAVHYKTEFDMDFTHWSKQASTAVDTLDNIRFIGRKFANEGRAPLHRDVVLEMLYWCKGDGEDAIMLSTAESYFMELSHYQEDLFDREVETFFQQAQLRMPHLVQALRERAKSYHHYQTIKYNPLDTTKQYRAPWDVDSVWSPHNAYGDVWIPHSGVLEQTDMRSAEEPSITQQGEVGNIHDQGTVVDASVDSMIISPIHREINLKEYDLNQALQRTYQIASLTVPSTAASGTLIATYDVMAVLFAQTFLSQKMNDFRGFISGAEFGFRFNTNQTLYGRLLIEFCPRANHEQFTTTSLQRATGSPHVLVSASAAGNIKFSVPFISPYRFLRLDSFEAGELGILNVWVLHPITSTLGTDVNAQLLVTAQFEGAKLVLPHSVSSPTSEWEIHSGKLAKQPVNKEAVAKVKAGVVTNSLVSNSIVKAGVRVFDFFSTYGPTIMGGLGMLGLSMPTSVAAVEPIRSGIHHDLVYGKGLSYVPKLAMDPENGISTEPVVGGISVDEMTFEHMLGTPAMNSNTTWIQGSSPGILLNLGPYGEQYQTFVDLITQQFAFHSGSYKAKLYITASHYHTVKMVFWLTDDPATSTAWQDCYYILVDIQGDTEVEMTLPYVEQGPMQSLNQGTSFALYGKILAWSAPSLTLPCPIYIACYKAGGPDFRVECYGETGLVPNNNPRADFAKVFPALQQDMKAYDPGNMVNGEVHTTLREVVHRMAPIGLATATVRVYNNIPYPAAVGGVDTYLGLEKWGCFFRFRRGSVRFKLVQSDNRYVEAVSVTNTYTNPFHVFGNYLSQSSNAQLEIEVPYYSRKYFTDITSKIDDTGNDLQLLATTNTSKYLYKAAGDDFSFHFLRLPPSCTFPYPVVPYGQGGAFVWAQASTPTNVHSV
jgi:hypothetical protein